MKKEDKDLGIKEASTVTTRAPQKPLALVFNDNV